MGQRGRACAAGRCIAVRTGVRVARASSSRLWCFCISTRFPACCKICLRSTAGGLCIFLARLLEEVTTGYVFVCDDPCAAGLAGLPRPAPHPVRRRCTIIVGKRPKGHNAAQARSRGAVYNYSPTVGLYVQRSHREP